MAETERLQLTLDKEDVELLDRLVKLCKLDRPKVVQDALVLLSWAVGAVSESYKIAAVDEANSKFREIETRALQRAKSLQRVPQANSD